MTPLQVFWLDQKDARLALDWFEGVWAIRRWTESPEQNSEEELSLATRLYKFRGFDDPPPRLRHLFEQQADPKRILSAGTMMRWLLEHRYKPDEYGTWISPDIGLDFLPAMWAYCGGTDTGGYKWLPEWFEGEK